MVFPIPGQLLNNTGQSSKNYYNNLDLASPTPKTHKTDQGWAQSGCHDASKGVLTMQPESVPLAAAEETSHVKDYLVYNILACIFCCPILGKYCHVSGYWGLQTLQIVF